MFVSLPDSHVETLTARVVVLVGGAFGTCISHASGTLINGIRAFIVEALRDPWPNSIM